MIDFRKVIPVVYQVQFKQVNNLALFIVVNIVLNKVRKRIFKKFFCISTAKMLILVNGNLMPHQIVWSI